MAFEDIDIVDITAGLAGIALTATAATPLIALPLSLLWFGQYAIRRSAVAKQWIDAIQTPAIQRHAQKLLPAPKDEVVQQRTGDTWVDRIRRPYGDDSIAVIKSPVKQTVIHKLPHYISHDIIPDPPTKTAVSIGYTGKDWLWADFGTDTLHALITGQTNCGKDSILRLWFTMLTANNSPQEIQFFIFDGKGEWLTPALLSAQHMFIAPVGGVEVVKENGRWVDLATNKIEEGVGLVFEEISKRSAAFQEVGATNIHTYESKTGIKLPLLFIVFTDVGTNIEQDLKTLVKMLTFKGRSFGIRLIISMQTVSGQDTGWRGQLALTLSGYQQLASADKPNVGIETAYMRYRPSELPSPDNPIHRGLFIMRKGSEQALVKTAHLPDTVFEHYCQTMLPQRNDFDLFTQLMKTAPKPEKVKVKKPILTPDQITYIIWQRQNGMTKTNIMTSLGFTNGDRYAEISPAVDLIIRAVDNKMQGVKK